MFKKDSNFTPQEILDRLEESLKSKFKQTVVEKFLVDKSEEALTQEVEKHLGFLKQQPGEILFDFNCLNVMLAYFMKDQEKVIKPQVMQVLLNFIAQNP
jgi:molybdopterin converting factor small subunit